MQFFFHASINNTNTNNNTNKYNNNNTWKIGPCWWVEVVEWQRLRRFQVKFHSITSHIAATKTMWKHIFSEHCVEWGRNRAQFFKREGSDSVTTRPQWDQSYWEGYPTGVAVVWRIPSFTVYLLFTLIYVALRYRRRLLTNFCNPYLVSDLIFFT